jgi:hypothetical protein
MRATRWSAWKLNRLARSARQLIDTVDALREGLVTL